MKITWDTNDHRECGAARRTLHRMWGQGYIARDQNNKTQTVFDPALGSLHFEKKPSRYDILTEDENADDRSNEGR